MFWQRPPETGVGSHGTNALQADGSERRAFLAELLFQLGDVAFEARPQAGKTGLVSLLEQRTVLQSPCVDSACQLSAELSAPTSLISLSRSLSARIA